MESQARHKKGHALAAFGPNLPTIGFRGPLQLGHCAPVLAPSECGLAVKKKRKLSPSPQQTSVGFLALPLLIMLIDLRPRNVILNIFPFGENHKRQRLAAAMVSTKVFNLSP